MIACIDKVIEREEKNLSECREVISHLTVLIREKEKFLEMIGKDNSQPFDDFSPKIVSKTEISHKRELEAELDACRLELQGNKDMQAEAEQILSILKDKRDNLVTANTLLEKSIVEFNDSPVDAEVLVDLKKLLFE